MVVVHKMHPTWLLQSHSTRYVTN